MTNKAFFIDRDGVINHDSGYVHTIESFEFLPGVFQACRTLNQLGYQIIIVTNQAGIGRGYYTPKAFAQLTEWMVSEFAKQQVTITDVYFCPHHQTKGVGEYKVACSCRKPEPGMILQAQKEHEIDLSQSCLVGDKVSDVMAGNAASLKQSFLVKGHYDATEDSEQFRYEDLLAVVQSLAKGSGLSEAMG